MLRCTQNNLVHRVGNVRLSSSTAPRQGAVATKVASSTSTAARPFSKFKDLRATSFGGIYIDNSPVLNESSSTGNRQATLVQSEFSLRDDAPAISRLAGRDAHRTDLGWSDGLSRSFAGRMQIRQQTGTLPPPTPQGSDRPQREDKKQFRRPTNASSRDNGSADRAQRPISGTKQQHGTRAVAGEVTSRQSPLEQPKREAAPASPKSSVTQAFKIQMAARKSTDLDTLFKASIPTPTASVSSKGRRVPASQLVDSRVWTVLERKGGDYSRHLPRYISGKSLLHPVRYARFVLGTRKELEYEGKQKVMQIIGTLADRRPQGEVRA